MTTLPSGLPVLVDRAAGTPLAAQISAQLLAAVGDGVLRAGDRLPSSRDLSVGLGVSRTVVTNAYARLFAEGWLECRQGSGTYVADVSAPPVQPLDMPRGRWPAVPNGRGPVAADVSDDPERNPAAPSPHPVSRRSPAPAGDLVELQPGVSWAEGVEPAAWRRAWRQASAHLPSRRPNPYGLPELRAEIAADLRRSRGLAVTPAQVLITQGVS
ncbi:MAG: GntR family transcriptional regulator, partial [Trebonia sp.]